MNWGELEWHEYAATGVLLATPIVALGMIGYMAYKCSPWAKESYAEWADKRAERVRLQKMEELEQAQYQRVQQKAYQELAPILQANAHQLLEDILDEETSAPLAHKHYKVPHVNEPERQVYTPSVPDLNTGYLS